MTPAKTSHSTSTETSDTTAPAATLDGIVSDFELLEDWEDRYRYVIELGRALPAFPESFRTDANKVRGCASQVWLATAVAAVPSATGPQPRLTFQGDSDAHIVRGLIAILLAVYSGKTAGEILAIDANAILRTLGLADHLSAQRSNGLTSMVERIRADARAASLT
jgi:cysteine desulfuration protein SufE